MNPTAIDIGLNKNIRSVSNIRVEHELSSDHAPVLFSLGEQHKIIKNKAILIYDETDWFEFRKLVNKSIILNPQI